MEQIGKKEYSDLQQGVHKLIVKFGMAKALNIIERLSGTEKMQTHEKKRTEALVAAFVTSEACKIFNTKRDKKNVNTTEYREARKASYYLIHKYTELSYSDIGKHFDQGKYGAYYHVKSCKETLSIPKYHKAFMKRFELLEQRLIEFIAEIN